jgi:hypothetical protein
MIQWILLLQQFDLQIIQRNEERLEDREPVDEEALPCIHFVFVKKFVISFAMV